MSRVLNTREKQIQRVPLRAHRQRVQIFATFFDEADFPIMDIGGWGRNANMCFSYCVFLKSFCDFTCYFTLFDGGLLGGGMGAAFACCPLKGAWSMYLNLRGFVNLLGKEEHGGRRRLRVREGRERRQWSVRR